MALQRQKREQDLKEQRGELERNSPDKGRRGVPSDRDGAGGGGGGSSRSTGSLLCAGKSNKRKKLSSQYSPPSNQAIYV